MRSPPNERTGVDAGWPLLFAFSRARPRATQAGHSATRFMRNYMSFFTLIALLFAGCAHRKELAPPPAHSTAAAIGTPRAVAPLTVVSNQFITTFGEHSVGGIWKVRVPEQDRTFEIGRLWESSLPDQVGTGSVSTKTSGWQAQAGWFVLVENDRRVWAYDGDRDLLLYEFTRTATGGVGCWSGPTKFDCMVPEAVLTRLSDAARKGIKGND